VIQLVIFWRKCYWLLTATSHIFLCVSRRLWLGLLIYLLMSLTASATPFACCKINAEKSKLRYWTWSEWNAFHSWRWCISQSLLTFKQRLKMHHFVCRTAVLELLSMSSSSSSSSRSQLGPSRRSSWTRRMACLQRLEGTDPVSLRSWSVQRAWGRPGLRLQSLPSERLDARPTWQCMPLYGIVCWSPLSEPSYVAE